MSDNRLIALNVFVIASALVAAIFLMSGCLQGQAQIELEAQTKCMNMRGDWTLASTSGQYTCKDIPSE